jgi:hypothetical protein
MTFREYLQQRNAQQISEVRGESSQSPQNVQDLLSARAAERARKLAKFKQTIGGESPKSSTRPPTKPYVYR